MNKKPPRHEIDRVGLHEGTDSLVRLGSLHFGLQKFLHAGIAFPDQVTEHDTRYGILGIDVVAELVRLIWTQDREGGIVTILVNLLDDQVALPPGLTDGDHPRPD